MSDLDNKLIFEAYSNNLLLEQLLNPGEMVRNIEQLLLSDTYYTFPKKFRGALGKVAAKSIIQWLNSEPKQDYGELVRHYDDNFDYLSNTKFISLSKRFDNIGKDLNRLEREGEWAWYDDEEKKKDFEDKYGIKHPRDLPEWMFNKNTNRFREDLYKWIPIEGIDSSFITQYIIDLFSLILSMKYPNEGEYVDDNSSYIDHIEDFFNDNRLSIENANLSGVKYAYGREGIEKYFLKQPVEHRLVSIYNDYNKFLKALKGNIDLEGAKKIYNDPKKALPIKDYGNGWKWVQLLDNDACRLSGDLMDHCVGGYDPLHPYSRILQLVGPDGDGHATIQLHSDMFVTRTKNKSYPVYNKVVQIKGKKNSILKPEYEQMVRDLLTSYKDKPLTTKLKNVKGDVIDFSAPVEQPTSYSYK